MRQHLTFRQLEIFEAIARLGSFTRASEELFLTQPTVSMQMKKLTDVVGVPLLTQSGKKVSLTADGRELAQLSREIADRLDRFGMSVAERRGLKKGHLSVVAITTAAYFAPRLLGEFSRLYPGIDVRLRVTNRAQVLASLADNLDDLYLMGTPPDEIDVVVTPVMDNPIVVLAAPDHPLATEKNIPLARLAAEPWIMRESGSGTRKAIENLFVAGGFEVRPRLELGSTEAIKQAILVGLGISAISLQALVLNPPGQFAMLDAQGFPVLRHWYAVHPASQPISVVANAFLEFLHGREPVVAPG